MLKKFNDLQENMDRQLNKIRKVMNNMSIKKETITKKELNKFWIANTITEFKNSLEGFTGQLGQAKKRIRKLKDKSFKTTVLEEQKEEWGKVKKAIGTYRTFWSWQYRHYESSRMRRHREKGTENSGRYNGQILRNRRSIQI